MKKGEKISQSYYNKHNQRIKDGHQHRLNSFNQHSTNNSSSMPNHQHLQANNQALVNQFSEKTVEHKINHRMEQISKNIPVCTKLDTHSSNKLVDNKKQ
jgi:hypothetical protein